MKKIFALLLVAIISLQVLAQQVKNGVPRPKLVVGIVVDQMRWDFLYRYADRYQANGGFKRLVNQGFSCENTLIPYTPTITACGHTCIYTGSVPAVHGITGNNWYDRQLNKTFYCTQDDSVSTVGAPDGTNGKMSPRNNFATTICDELRLATNFQSKVIGVAIKDRGGILPAGHSANAAYWYDSRNGNWITSTYYMQQLPQWVNDFNNKKLADKYYTDGWKTMYPINTYTQSTADEKKYEAKPFGADAKGFPYDLTKNIGKNYGVLASTPFGNTMTLEMAKAALTSENMGADAVTDFLAVSLSSTDYVGHAFGPNSVETEDTYLRLDKDLGAFFAFLDAKVGKGQWLMFLSADHGVAHVPGFMEENKLPGGLFFDDNLIKEMNASLKQQYGADSLIINIMNYQVHLNKKKISDNKLDEEGIEKWIIEKLLATKGILNAFSLREISEATLPSKIKSMIENGYYPNRSGDIQFILKPGWIDAYSPTGTTHGLWNPYDSHIPLVWYGWNIKPGKSNHEVYMTDIAPTVAALLRIQMPSGCVGKPIEEVTK